MDEEKFDFENLKVYQKGLETPKPELRTLDFDRLRTPNSELRTVFPRNNSLDEILVQLTRGGAPASPRKVLFQGERAEGIASYVAGWMAEQGMDVIVVDGANRFDPYTVSSYARRVLISPEEILKRIRIARAFTCYQMATLMGERLSELFERERSGLSDLFPSPFRRGRVGVGVKVIILGPLTTFLDEDVPEREVQPLFERALSKAGEMAAAGVPFFLFQSSISAPHRPSFAKGGFSRRACLTKRLAQFSDRIWRVAFDDQGTKMVLEKGLESKTSLQIENCKMKNGN